MRKALLIGLVLPLLMNFPASGDPVGSVRITAGAAELRAPDFRSSGAGWLAGIELEPHRAWPFFGISFGDLPMPKASRPLGLMRFGATYLVSPPGDGLQFLISGGAQWARFPGGAQWARFPGQDELPLAPGGVLDAHRLSGVSPYLGAGVGLEVRVGRSSRLSMNVGISDAFIDGSSYWYPSAGVSLLGDVAEW